MFILLYFLFLYNLIIWNPCLSYYTPSTPGRMRGKLNMLCKELLIDATSKFNSIQHLKRVIRKSSQYQYGGIVYQMRDRYKKMLQLYSKVSNAIETSPVLDGNDKVPDDRTYLNELAEMDSLAHEILNFATMIQIHRANIHGDKSKLGYNLFFRRHNEAPAWLGLLDSLDNNDTNDPPEPPPENNNLTRTGKRKNGIWHYAVSIE